MAVRRSKLYPATLEGVMEWAFEGHGRKCPDAELNLDELLGKAKRNPAAAVNWLNSRLAGNLSPKDTKFMIAVLKGAKQRNVKVHSRLVLQFMSDLFHRGSTIPPPWRT